jgi:hypothetical protein
MTAEKVYEAIEQGVCTAIIRLVRNGSVAPSADFFAALAKGVKDAMAEGVKGGVQVVPPLVSHAPDCAITLNGRHACSCMPNAPLERSARSDDTLRGVVRLKNQLSEVVGCLQTKRLPRDVDGCVRWNQVEADMHRYVDEMVRANR